MSQATNASHRHIVVVKSLIAVAALGTLMALTAGLIFLLNPPAVGSTTEATLGFTAAAGGLTAAIFYGAAAVYAQIRGLWQYAPRWVRVGSWIVLAAVVMWSIWGSITSGF